MILVRGASAAERQALHDLTARALGDIGRGDLSVTVDVEGGVYPPADGGEAWSTDEGFGIHRSLLQGRPIANPKVAWLVYEEVAHFVLAEAGVPHEGDDGRFFQELFATWFQYESLVNGGLIEARLLDTWPVSEGDFMVYDLAKHLGAALAGSAANREHLERWLAAPRDPAWATRVRESEAELAPPLTPEAVAAVYASRTW